LEDEGNQNLLFVRKRKKLFSNESENHWGWQDVINGGGGKSVARSFEGQRVDVGGEQEKKKKKCKKKNNMGHPPKKLEWRGRKNAKLGRTIHSKLKDFRSQPK